MYYTITTNKEELYHHGIKGQIHGVRNGPPYPLSREISTGKRLRTFKESKNARQANKQDKHLTDRHRIKKGTKMYRVTTNANENNQGSTYVTYQKADRAFYRYYIGQNAERDGRNKTYEKTFELNEDLIIPSRDDMKEAFNNALNKVGKKSLEKAAEGFVIGDRVANQDIKQAEKDLKQADKMWDALAKIQKDPNTIDAGIYKSKKGDEYGLLVLSKPKDGKGPYVMKEEKTIPAKTLENGESLRQARKVLEGILEKVGNKEMSEYALGMGTLTKNPEVKAEMIKELKSKGFNAMVDEAGVGSISNRDGNVTREGIETLIVFDRDKTLKETSNKEYDYKQTGNKDLKEYYTYMNRMRKRKNF